MDRRETPPRSSAVSEREAAEDALRLRAHLASAPLAVVEWDASRRISGFSPGAEALLGWSAAEVLGKGVEELPFVPEEDRASAPGILGDGASAEPTASVQTIRSVRKDGAVVHCEWYHSKLHGPGGRLASALSVVVDATERRRVERALRESEARATARATELQRVLDEQRALEDQLSKVAASVPGLICSYLLRPDGTACMPFTTAAVEDLYGIPGEVLARDFGPVLANLHADDVQRVVARLAEAARAVSRWHDTFRYLHPTKGVRWLEGWSVPKAQPDGSILWHGYVMDVTDRKVAEEALRRSDQRKTEFLAILSHELRNPLAPIRNGIYLLEQAAPGSDQGRRAIAVIRRQTEHLARLVDDLLDVTRISRGKIDLRRARADLRELVRRTCDDHRPVFDGRRIELRVEAPAEPVWIDADATRVAQVIGNLLQNAAKFSHEGALVTVRVDRADGRAELRVRDEGIGIAPELLPRIFEPFVQGPDGLARTRGGLGLGLSLVKALVELHGGTVRASSAGADAGAEFVASLPLAAGLAPASPPGEAAPPRQVAVLVIEDNVDAAQTIAEVLTLEGHRVEVATDGRSGIARARELRPDVVLCDIGLPDVDGYEVARALRADEALRGTRLVALSGYALPEDKERAREAGFEAHLAKPATLDDLAAIVSGS